MDGTRFDQLIKSIATTRVSRLTALRGLAAGGVAALTGISLFAEEADAAKDNKPKRRKACLCSPTTGCQTKKVKKRARFIRRNAPCAYKGKCTSFNPCPAATPITTTTTAAPAPPGFNCVTAGCVGVNAGLLCNEATGQCVNCTSFNECNDRPCVNGRCRGGERCANNPQCVNSLPAGFEPMVCNVDGDQNDEAPNDICILDPDDYYDFLGGGECDSDADCEFLEDSPPCCIPAGFSFACIQNTCVQTCDDQDECDDLNPDFVCTGGACIRED